MIASRIITNFNLIKKISIAVSSKAVAWAILNPINSDILGNVIDRLASRVSDAFKHFLKGSFCLRCDRAGLLKFLLAFVVQGVKAGSALRRKQPSHSDLTTFRQQLIRLEKQHSGCEALPLTVMNETLTNFRQAVADSTDLQEKVRGGADLVTLGKENGCEFTQEEFNTG